MPLIAGIDSGSGFTKAVLVAEQDGRPLVVARGRVPSGIRMEEAATAALQLGLAQAGLARSDVEYVVATGFGRYSIGFRDVQVTEITSAARGAWFLWPETECVLDIGSQSTRAIGLQPGGKVRAFKINDKCAAGSGMFIVRAAKYLDTPLEQVGALSMASENPQPISSICAVLAESEIINHVSAGVGVEDLFRGIHESLADRAAAMLKRVGLAKQVTFIGGVARQTGLVEALRRRLGVQVCVPDDCDYVCAVGAALLGSRRLQTRRLAAGTSLA